MVWSSAHRSVRPCVILPSSKKISGRPHYLQRILQAYVTDLPKSLGVVVVAVAVVVVVVMAVVVGWCNFSRVTRR